MDGPSSGRGRVCAQKGKTTVRDPSSVYDTSPKAYHPTRRPTWPGQRTASFRFVDETPEGPEPRSRCLPSLESGSGNKREVRPRAQVSGES